MKFPNLKKYFFAHAIVILFYLMVLFILWALWLDAHYPSEEYSLPGEPGVGVYYPGTPQMWCAVVCGILGWFTITFTIIEALLRKFVVEKYFPNLKLPFTIKLPKWICVTHSIFFYFGLIPMICIDTYFFILGIINVFSK